MTMQIADNRGAWRSESVLILRSNAQLPSVCMRCGRATAERRLHKVYSWHSPFIYLLALQPFLYVIVALLARKKVSVLIPLCRKHLRLRRLGVTFAWTMIPAGTIACIWGLAIDSMLLGILGLYVTLAACVLAVMTTWIVHVVRIDAHFGRLRGAHASLLDQLIDWDSFEAPGA